VIGEFESSLPRLEQQIRWASEKAASIGSSDLVGPGPAPRTSKLLVLRSTESTRGVARTFEATLRAAYPASTREAVESLRTGSPWPGDAIVWIRIEGDRVDLLDGPPRGSAWADKRDRESTPRVRRCQSAPAARGWVTHRHTSTPKSARFCARWRAKEAGADSQSPLTALQRVARSIVIAIIGRTSRR
jgi:hypothetical protein